MQRLRNLKLRMVAFESFCEQKSAEKWAFNNLSDTLYEGLFKRIWCDKFSCDFENVRRCRRRLTRSLSLWYTTPYSSRYGTCSLSNIPLLQIYVFILQVFCLFAVVKLTFGLIFFLYFSYVYSFIECFRNLCDVIYLWYK